MKKSISSSTAGESAFISSLRRVIVPPSRPSATYSIVAIDRKSRQMGVAVQSHWFSVGSLVTWAEPGTGVVATQSFVEASYGPLGLALMRGGKTPQQALKSLLATDPRPEMRQVAMLDARGRVAVYTGSRCIPEAGHLRGRGVAVQANLGRNKRVWRAMATAFRRSKGSLATRMLNALDAGEAAGGDRRGRQSAAMLIVRTVASGTPWQDKILDLRVEDHTEPLAELRRLVRLHEAYDHANRADDLVAKGKMEEAFKDYERAAERAPELEELKFWTAVTLLNVGRVAEGKTLLRRLYARNKEWKHVLRMLVRVKMLKVDRETTRSLT